MKGRLREASFWLVLGAVGGGYLLFVLALLLALAVYASPAELAAALAAREIQYAALLSLVSCTVAAQLALLVAAPAGYLLSRGRFPGKSLIEAVCDAPLVLPPMVLGLCLLIFFQTPPGRLIERAVPFTYTVFGVTLAQFVLGTAFALRTMRSTFDHLSPRAEDVARTLGCGRWGAFFRVAVPSARRGLLAALTVAWARGLGEFGPVLVFAGTIRLRTEVLPTAIFLELSTGNLEAAVAVALLLVGAALAALAVVRGLKLQDHP